MPIVWSGDSAKWLVALGGLNCILIFVWFVHHLRIQRGQAGLLARRWSLVDLAAAVQFALIILAGIGIAAAILLRPVLQDASEPLGARELAFLAIMTLAQFGVLAGAAVALCAGKYQMSWSAFGLDRLNSSRLALGTLYGVGALAASALSIRIFEAIDKGPLGNPFTRDIASDPSAQAVQEFAARAMDSPIFVLAIVAVVAGLAPFCEELFFRGLLLRSFSARMGRGFGIVISSLIFAAAHGSAVGFVPRFIMGALFASVTLRTGSLWPAIVAHAANNSVALFALMQ